MERFRFCFKRCVKLLCSAKSWLFFIKPYPVDSNKPDQMIQFAVLLKPFQHDQVEDLRVSAASEY